MQITQDALAAMLPHCKDPATWAQLLSDNLEDAGISSVQQTAYFIAQCGHESSDFNTLMENLNYGAPGLLATFGKYFTSEKANEYARQPEKIANRVYANRMGNGDENSGDGWKFRGRGLIQCTGKNAYTECSQSLFGDDSLLSNPDLLLQPEAALKSALWFWTKNNLAEITDFVTLTKRINGGTNGLDDRTARMKTCMQVLE